MRHSTKNSQQKRQEVNETRNAQEISRAIKELQKVNENLVAAQANIDTLNKSLEKNLVEYKKLIQALMKKHILRRMLNFVLYVLGSMLLGNIINFVFEILKLSGLTEIVDRIVKWIHLIIVFNENKAKHAQKWVLFCLNQTCRPTSLMCLTQ